MSSVFFKCTRGLFQNSIIVQQIVTLSLVYHNSLFELPECSSSYYFIKAILAHLGMCQSRTH